LPGAYATLLLARLGAEIVKIEDPRGGDTMRTLAGGPSRYFEPLNRGKRSVTLDLRSPHAAAVLDAMLAHADVLVESFRPSTARRLGVDGGTIRARHPRIVCVSMSGFGQSGPYAERAAHDINYQALAGLLRPPLLPGPLVGDIGSAQQAALAIVAALFERSRTGVGCAIDISIHEAAREWAMFPDTGDLAQARYNLYETSDGAWLALGALEEKFWTGFCERANLPITATVDDVRRTMRSRTRDAWLALFADADVCLTSVDAHDGVARESANAPALGADTDTLLEEAGLGPGRRDDLRRAGVI
jgi:crotonobetainyl-CoA:carnitine CoA-transferase CaiB-like acyl-CoA transferase